MSIYSTNILSVGLSVRLQRLPLLLMDVFILVNIYFVFQRETEELPRLMPGKIYYFLRKSAKKIIYHSHLKIFNRLIHKKMYTMSLTIIINESNFQFLNLIKFNLDFFIFMDREKNSEFSFIKCVDLSVFHIKILEV